VIPTLFSVGCAILLLASILPLVMVYKPNLTSRRLALCLLIGGLICILAASAIQFYDNREDWFHLLEISGGLNLSFHLDRLSAFFSAIISVAGISCAIYSLAYNEHDTSGVKCQLLTALTSLFILLMLLVVTSATLFAFIFFWEMMSISSFLMVMYEYEKPETQRAALFYFTMTQISTVCLMLAFLNIYSITGSADISAANTISLPAKNLIFAALFIGFGTKAGIVPFHKWLPYAHSASPSSISALMSGVMLKIAIYGMVRFILEALQPELWWGLVMLTFGTLSALIGIIYAFKECDLKKLLAYCSIENIGVIVMGLGLYIIFNTYGMDTQASLSITGALFHTLNHAICKSLLFMSAGSVVQATGTRNIEAMGGLARLMPLTAIIFLVGSFSICALPPLNGFASEIMLFEAYLGSFNLGHPMIAVVLFTGLAIFALTSALAVATFVKAFGLVFLALPRSEATSKAKEVPAAMLIGPAMLGLCCVILGIFARQIVNSVVPGLPVPDMLPVAIILIIVLLLAWLFVHLQRVPVRISPTWGCGISEQTSCMEYTANGFAEPIVTIFRWIFRTRKVLKREYFDETQSLPSQSSGAILTLKFFEERLYLPIAHTVQKLSAFLSNKQNADLDALIMYAFAAIVLLILCLGWWL
jgi:formate hydrogenlyase subunit 3/multisubunit Na+/H+ antiporter MnhD subunit